MRFFLKNGHIMIMVICAGLIIGGCTKQPPAAALVAPPDVPAADGKKDVVARVNGAVIDSRALLNMVNRMNAINTKTSTTVPPEETRRMALDQLIYRELAYQEAVRQGLSIEEQRIDNEMNKLITSMGHEEGFQDFLKKENMTSLEVRSQVERGLLLQRIAGQEVLAKVTVPEEDVRDEYARRKNEYFTPEKITVTDVVFFLDQNDPETLRKAAGILDKINADKDKDPANLSSDGTFAVQSLELKKEKEPELYEAARKLKEGELAGPIKTSDSVHVIRLTKYEPEKQASYEEVKDRLMKSLKAAAQVKRFQEWEQELRKGAKIEVLDDKGMKQ
jgi:parvulin-like peptidyl-prolyl isomerase